MKFLLLLFLLWAALVSYAVALPQHTVGPPVRSVLPSAKQPRSSPSQLWKRGWWSDFKNKVKNAGEHALGWFYDNVVDKALPQELEGMPLPERFQDWFDIDDERTNDLPMRVFNFPSYGYWTDEGWQLRIRAMVYKQPEWSEHELDEFLEKRLATSPTGELPPDQRDHAHNTTASLMISQRYEESLAFSVTRIRTVDGLDWLGERQCVTHPQTSSTMGDLDAFVPLEVADLDDGDLTMNVQRLEVNAADAELGRAESWLVPPDGVSVISDLDDIIKETVLWHPIRGAIKNTVLTPDIPWSNMPSVLNSWAQTFPDLHFHYTSLTPEQLGRTTLKFLQDNYPPGSLDLRAMTKDGLLKGRLHLLEKTFETFPQRKFVLLGDTSTSELLKAYTSLLRDRPGRVQCVFIRNVSVTDPTFIKPYDSGLFADIDKSKYLFFRVPDDLLGLDIPGGECVNTTFQQNLTFSIQNMPLVEDGEADELFRILPFLKWFVDML